MSTSTPLGFTFAVTETSSTVAPASSVIVADPDMLAPTGTGLFAGIVNENPLLITPPLIGQGGIGTVTFVPMMGTFAVQLAPHNGHASLKGRIPSTLKSSENLLPPFRSSSRLPSIVAVCFSPQWRSQSFEPYLSVDEQPLSRVSVPVALASVLIVRENLVHVG